MMFDMILINGNVITLENSVPKARWLGIRNGKIAAVGVRDDYPDEAGEIVDLQGKTVIPGLIDSHMHACYTGKTLTSSYLEKAESLSDVLDIMKEACLKENGDGLISAIHLNPEKLKEKRLPTRQDLDPISGEHPVVLYHQSLHGMVLNSKALNMSGILDTAELKGDQYETMIDGIIEDDSNVFAVNQRLLESVSEETLRSYIHACDQYVLSKGCTTIHALNGSDQIRKSAEIWQQEAGSLGVHSVHYWENWDVQEVKKYELPRVGGCLCLDGARATHTAAYSEPFSDKPDSRGFLYFKDIDVFNFIYQAHKNDMQAAMHAMGDRAIDQIIYIIDSVTKQLGNKGLRHRIEHFSYPTERHIEMAVELGLALPMQPIWSELWDNKNGSVLERILGKERAEKQEPFARLVKAGAMICGGSDCPVTPVDPIKGIHLLVNNSRESRNISVTDALKIWTYNCAWAAHEENIKGTIKEGKLADLTIVDKDPYEYSNAIDSIVVEMAIVEGKVLYTRS